MRRPAALLLVLMGCALPAGGQVTRAVLEGLPITELNENEAIVHALNRLASGRGLAISSACGGWVSRPRSTPS